MDAKTIKEALRKAKDSSQKRNFSQSVDLIISLKNVDIKNADSQLDFFVQLHYPVGKKIRVCALVGPELSGQAKDVCDETITDEQFRKYSDAKILKRLASSYDYFIAQATLMPKIATTFGKALGSRGKMPNPKAGCIVPPNAALKPLVERLQNTVRVKAKTIPVVHSMVGKEDQPEEQVIDNILTVFNQVRTHLPNEINNIKDAYVKLTMGKPVSILKQAPADEGMKVQAKEGHKEEDKDNIRDKEKKGKKAQEIADLKDHVSVTEGSTPKESLIDDKMKDTE